MSPRAITDSLVRPCPVLGTRDTVAEAVARLLDTDLPALPVVGGDRHLCGIFGEREFFGALFPRYLGELHYAGFVPRALEDSLAKRATCRVETVREHMNTEHVDVGTDFSDASVAETFLHHRVLILPVVEHGRIVGVITRGDFFGALARRFLAGEG